MDIKLIGDKGAVQISKVGVLQAENLPLEPEENVEGLTDPNSSFFVDDDSQLPITIIGPDNKEITPDDIIIPPDGGWGWVIVFAAFFANLILDGTANTSGIILLSIMNWNKDNRTEKYSDMDTVNITASHASWVIGILYGCSMLVGPFVSILANTLGFRITSVFGSIIGSTGYILVYIFCSDGTPNIIVLFLCYGLLGGVGIGFVYVPAIIAVGFYFHKKRALATGIAVCGSGVGTIIFPPWVTPLTEKYGWEITVLVQGIILAASSLLGCLYRPLKPVGQKTDLPKLESFHHKSKSETTILINVNSEEEVENMDEININSSDESIHGAINEFIEDMSNETSSLEIIGTNQSRTTGDIFTQNGMNNLEKLNGSGRVSGNTLLGIKIPSNDSDLSGNRKTLRLNKVTSGMNTGGRQKIITLLLPDSENDITQSRVYRTADKDALNSAFNINSIFHPGPLNQFQNCDDDAEGLVCEAVQVPTEALHELPAVPTKKKCKCDTDSLRKILDVSLLKSWTFILLIVAAGFTSLGFYTPLGAFPALVTDIDDNPVNDGSMNIGNYTRTDINIYKKFTAEQAGTLISIIGGTNIICRILIGAIADKLEKHILVISNIALTIGGLCTIATPFLKEYYLLAIYSGIYGISEACYTSLRSIILVQLLGLGKLTNAFGLLLLFQGLAAILGGPISGSLHDVTSNYYLIFFVCGGALALSGVLGFPLRYVNNYEMRIKSEQSQKKRTSQ